MVQVLHGFGRKSVYSRSMTPLAAIVLAAGLGTRMASAQPKVLHRVAGRSLLGHVLAAVAELAPQRTIVVAGPDQAAVASEARRHIADVETVVQAERLGTGHAVQMAAPLLQSFTGRTIILFGDCPNISAATLRALLAEVDAKTSLAVLGFRTKEPTGYGRLITKGKKLLAIREELEATKRERAITLCNSGVMAVDAQLMARLLPKLENCNTKKEYYITDLVELAAKARKPVSYVECPAEEVLGVNTRAQLAAVEAELQRKLRARAMEHGATLVAPETVFLCADTRIGRDVLIEPNVTFGPGVSVADNVVIRSFSHIEGATIAAGATVGPFARLRPGAALGADVHVGNFVEIKNASVETGAKVNHLSYVGDARVGAGANVGAGTITCNYDGVAKHHTDIGKGAFIGSNTSLVAPVKIGDGAYIGSGSVITREVEADALAVERSPVTTKPGWASRFRAAAQARKAAKKSE